MARTIFRMAADGSVGWFRKSFHRRFCALLGKPAVAPGGGRTISGSSGHSARMTWLAVMPLLLAAGPPALSPQEARIYWEWRAAELEVTNDCLRRGSDPQEATQHVKQRIAEEHGMTVEQLDAVVAKQQAIYDAENKKTEKADWLLVVLFVANIPLYILLGWLVFGGWAGLGDLWSAEGPIDSKWATMKLSLVILMSVCIVFAEWRYLTG